VGDSHEPPVDHRPRGGTADVVYDIVADPSRGPEWQTLVSELGDVAGRPGGIGSSYVGYYKLAGRRVDGPLRRHGRGAPDAPPGGWDDSRRLGPLDDDDRAHWRRGGIRPCGCPLEYELPGEVVGSLFGMLTGNRLEAEFKRTYLNLKRLAESAVVAREPVGGDSAA
jgi:hypothetical protein